MIKKDGQIGQHIRGGGGEGNKDKAGQQGWDDTLPSRFDARLRALAGVVTNGQSVAITGSGGTTQASTFVSYD